jgi:hypothetical protein
LKLDKLSLEGDFLKFCQEQALVSAASSFNEAVPRKRQACLGGLDENHFSLYTDLSK